MNYLHPIAGGITIFVLAYAASLGLRMRAQRNDRSACAAAHARLAAIAYGLVLSMWLTGVLSVVWERSDLDPAASLHFRIGTAITILMTGGAVTARGMQRGRQNWRDIHPWLGAAAALLAAGHFVAGLQITP